MADEGYNGSDIYRLMNAKPGKTATLDLARDSAKDLAKAHHDLATRIKTLQKKIDGHWEGDSAEAAKYSLQPVIDSSDIAATDLENSTSALESQSGEFHTTVNALEPMEGDEPSRSFGDWVSPWQTDHEDEIGVWAKSNTHNLEQYSKYEGSSSSNEWKMPHSFPELPEGTKASMQVSPAGNDVGPMQSGSQVGGPSGGSGTGAGGGAYSAPMTARPQVSSTGSGSGYGSSGSPVRPGSYVPPSTSTVPAGYTAPAAASGSNPFQDPAAAFGAVGAGRDAEDARARPGAPGSGFGPGARGGIGPGGRPLGGAPGAPGSGQGLAGGRMSGVAPGGSPAAGVAGGPGAAGAAGRGGAGMMGPMGGAGGGRGEDQEHQRKYIQDSDEWFKPERDEDGGIMRDPTTGFVVLPPGGVIGE